MKKHKQNRQSAQIDWRAIVVENEDGKKAVSIRLDKEVLEYFRQDGRGYQTRINAVLRSFVASQK